LKPQLNTDLYHNIVHDHNHYFSISVVTLDGSNIYHQNIESSKGNYYFEKQLYELSSKNCQLFLSNVKIWRKIL